MIRFVSLIVLLFGIGLVGCSTDDPLEDTAVGGVVSGETRGVDGFLRSVEYRNEQEQRREELLLNQATVRAFNLKTGTFQFVDSDTVQRWNNEKQRWEFHPDLMVPPASP